MTLLQSNVSCEVFWTHIHKAVGHFLFSKIILLDLPLMPVSILTMGFLSDLQHNTCVSFSLRSLKSNKKANCYSHKVHVTIIPIGISCHTIHYCNSQASQLDKTTENRYLWAAYIASFSTINASYQGIRFLVNANLIFVFPNSNMYGVFNTRVLPSSTGGQLRTMAINCIGLGWQVS